MIQFHPTVQHPSGTRLQENVSVTPRHVSSLISPGQLGYVYIAARFPSSIQLLITCTFQPNGANLTGDGGTGTTNPFATPSVSDDPYVPFNGQSSDALPSLPAAVGFLPALVLGAVIGIMSVYARI